MSLQLVSPAAAIKSVQLAHTSATTAKLPVVVNSTTAIPLNTADADEQNTFVYESEITGAPKTTGQAWAFGEILYFDTATGKFTNVAGSLKACGVALAAAALADTTSGLIAFRGF